MNDFDLNSINKYFKFKCSNVNNYFQIISEDTSMDLDLDFLFFKLDKTLSKIGKQFFYSKFKIIDKENDIYFEKYQEYFQNNKYDDIELNLKKLNKYKDYEVIELIKNDIIVNNKYLSYAKLSTIMFFIVLLMSIFIKQMLLFTIVLFVINLYFHYKNKSYVEYYNQIISRLQKTISIAYNIHKINPIFKEEYNKINLKKLKRSIWMTNVSNQFSNNELLVIFWLLFEIIQIIFNLEIFIFNKNVKILNNSKQELLNVFEFIGKIDASINIYKIKSEYSTCKPVFINDKSIKINKIYHPLIENCIKNDLNLINNSIAITGSNMSGKTSFMRTVASNIIIAESLGFCFAEKMEIPFMKVLSSISIQDDINENKSYYLEEVLRIKSFLEFKDSYNLILIDEIFKGTNTTERIAISKTVLKYLNSDKNIVFITTHDLEIANYLKNYKYDLYYFSEDINNDELKFTFKLNLGLNPNTNAIKILKLYNYPKEIIEESYNQLNIGYS